MNKINYYHSLIFFNLCISLSAFEFLRDNSLLILSLFLILSLGISHGALDHIKGKKLLKLLNYKSTSTFYILYVLVGLSVILLWFLFSKILLLIFLIVASYHFGTGRKIEEQTAGYEAEQELERIRQETERVKQDAENKRKVLDLAGQVIKSTEGSMNIDLVPQRQY